jgi:hypothetical protein
VAGGFEAGLLCNAQAAPIPPQTVNSVAVQASRRLIVILMLSKEVARCCLYTSEFRRIRSMICVVERPATISSVTTRPP